MGEEEFAENFNYVANGSAARTFDLSKPRFDQIDEFGQAEIEWPEPEENLEERLEGTNGTPIGNFTPAAGMIKEVKFSNSPRDRNEINQNRTSPVKTTAGIKRRTPRQIKEDMPPTPHGCEWRRADEGWGLWRCWSEPGEVGQGKIKKTRYAGHLSHDAWQIMKEFDHETILSNVGQRLRRHGRG